MWLKERGGNASDPLFPTRTGGALTRDALANRVTKYGAPVALGVRVGPPSPQSPCYQRFGLVCAASQLAQLPDPAPTADGRSSGAARRASSGGPG